MHGPSRSGATLTWGRKGRYQEKNDNRAFLTDESSSPISLAASGTTLLTAAIARSSCAIKSSLRPAKASLGIADLIAEASQLQFDSGCTCCSMSCSPLRVLAL